MKVWAILIALALGMAMVPSCKEKSQVSSRVIVTAVGIDGTEGSAEGVRLAVQTVEPLLTSGSLTEQKENATAVYEAEGETVADALNSFVSLTGRSAFILHNRVIAIGLEQAKSGTLASLTDYFIRSREGRPLADVVISRTTAADLLSQKSTAFTIPSEQISMLLQEGRRRGTAVRTRLLDLERASSGMYDVAIPIVEAMGEGEESRLCVTGTALFRGGTYVGEADPAATRGLLLLQEAPEACPYVLDRGEEGCFTAEIEKASCSIRVEQEGERAHFYITTGIRAAIADESRPRRLTEEMRQGLEKALAEEVQADIRRAVDQSVIRCGCDAIGLQRRIMQQIPSLVKEGSDRWPEELRSCSYEIEVKAEIAQFGEEAELSALVGSGFTPPACR
ncbi:MAG: hypothetical protein HFJ80_06820 [Clostridiales bacterium]|nr:hypothetical protein [Clostridiales bacterium]